MTIASLKKGRNFIEKDEEKANLENEKTHTLSAYNEAMRLSRDNGNTVSLLKRKIEEEQESLSAIAQFLERIKSENYDCYLLAERRFETVQQNKAERALKKSEADSFLKIVDSKIASTTRDIENYQKNYINAYNCEYCIGIDFTEKYINEYYTLIQYDIIDKLDKLERVRHSCELQFRNDFLAKLKDSIEAAELQFEKLNKVLKDVNYGNEKYKFDSKPREDRRNLYDMIKADFNLGGNTLFGSEFEERYKEEITDLFDKVSTEESGEKKLSMIIAIIGIICSTTLKLPTKTAHSFFRKYVWKKAAAKRKRRSM